MNRNELELRFIDFSKRAIHLYDALKSSSVGRHLGFQLVRAATSVGANYAEAAHGRSGAEFISKIKLSEGEAAEARYWLTLIIETNLLSAARVAPLRDEAQQLVSILHAAALSCQRNQQQKNNSPAT